MISRSLRRAGFTLIEILTVIAIIAVLASLILATSGFVQEKAGRSRAEAEIQALSNAIEAYKLDNGVYPDGDGGTTSTKKLIDELCPPTSGGGTGSTKVYFEFPPKMLDGYSSGSDFETLRTSARYLVDPFGNSYRYKSPGDKDRSGEQFFDLWSYGKDGATKNADLPEKWIKNW